MDQDIKISPNEIESLSKISKDKEKSCYCISSPDSIDTNIVIFIDFEIGHQNGGMRINHQNYLTLNDCHDEINDLVGTSEDNSDDSSANQSTDVEIKIDENQLYLVDTSCG